MTNIEDKRISLPGGRVVAYAESGNLSSSVVVLFLHGGFGIGDASRPPPIILEKGVHYVCPSLPGCGHTSPALEPLDKTYAATLYGDVTALLTRLHPVTSDLRVYVVGHSGGTIAAQILYGASYDAFPLGRQIAGLALLSPVSPPHAHTEYGRYLSWPAYLMIGPASHYIPFNAFLRLLSLAIGSKLKTDDDAVAFLRSSFTEGMGESETALFARWRAVRGMEEGQFERELGRRMRRSVEESWAGFLTSREVMHCGWGGFHPNTLDEEHSERPVWVVAARQDTETPLPLAEWVAANYKGARLEVIEGRHLAPFFYMDEMFKVMLSTI